MRRRRLLILLAGAISALALLVLAGPVMVRLGVQPVCIQGQWPNLRVVSCPPAAGWRPSDVSTRPHVAVEPRAVIIDTDMAPDDWMAILYLLRRSDVDVKAITVAGTGEAHCGPGVQNAKKLAALAEKPAIPVACGRSTPLQGNRSFPQPWRDWADRLAGLSLPSGEPVSTVSAVELLRAAISESSDKVAIVVLGPLTNLGDAFEAEPTLASHVEMIYIMGGAFQVAGNVGQSGFGIQNESAEWNMYVDPHAAAVTVRSGAPMTFVPLDATNQAPLTKAFYDRMTQDRSTPTASFVFQVLGTVHDRLQSDFYWFWDPLAAAIWADESLATFSEQHVTVSEEEGPSVGSTRFAGSGAPARIAVKVDRAAFERQFLAVLNGRSP